MGPFPPLFGNQYILLVVDYVSKWVEAIACQRNDAKTVVGFIQRNILSIFGVRRTIISDEGSHFSNKLFEKLMSRYCRAPVPDSTRRLKWIRGRKLVLPYIHFRIL